MGKAVQPSQAVLFAAFMFKKPVNTEEILDALVRRYGPIDMSYGPVRFDFTDYYAAEMGRDLRKIYLTFERRIRRDDLAGIKVFTNELEERHGAPSGRTINIDPGYITRDKLVLASTKDFYHRIYLSDGIFAETTLHYRKGLFRFFSWTYPDYMTPEFLAFLEKARARLVKTLCEE